MAKWRPGRWVLLLALALAAAACAMQPEGFAKGDSPPSFFSGLLHGFGLVIAFISQFFSNKIHVYAFPNAGWPYDLGFIIGAGLFFGAGGASARR
jgi:hypothetical protein